MIQVRVGIPIPNGSLLDAARERGYPVLLSANAFYRAKAPKGHPGREWGELKFRIPPQGRFDGMDVALDSAGFVAASKYGDFQWSVDEYLDLAQAAPWSWYASMDYCCEPQVSNDPLLRGLRIAATVQMLGRCRRGAAERGIPMPMPVIQGWHASEYVRCAQLMPLVKWPDLVGVGSVCRRHVFGPDGVLNIIQALDAVLPPNVKLHLFGVKSTALAQLAGHPRIGAMDSMAWDFGARMERREGRDMAFRIERMERWAEAQQAIAAAGGERLGAASNREGPESARHIPAGHQFAMFERDDAGMEEAFQLDDAMAGPPLTLFDPALYATSAPDTPHTPRNLVLRAVAAAYEELLLGDSIDYGDAVVHSKRDAYPALASLHNHGGVISVDLIEHLDDVLPGVGSALGEIPQVAAALALRAGSASRSLARAATARETSNVERCL